MRKNLYDTVIEWIPEGSKVLDLGTGDGEFLERLIVSRKAKGEGVEINPDLVTKCIERGLVVHQGDILDGLDQYGNGAFDYILLLGTMQELIDPQRVINEAFRVGKYVIVSYSNFAHLRARLQMMFSGKAPVTSSLPCPWYKTPNLHFCSILDFMDFCNDIGAKIIKSAYFKKSGQVKFLPNIFAEYAVSMIEKA
ncbi:MAG TPA: methionine biosynthesis protein MetW [Verrucomicrobiota bacterium]|nr:methionine biosynthesis protein MetW [Verrucomicrobiota bacterium]